MAGTDFSHLTDDELLNGIKALNIPDYIRTKSYGVDVRETLAQMTEMLMQLAYNQGMDPQQAQDWVSKLNKKITKGQVTMSDLSQEIKEAFTGGAVAVVGVGAVTPKNTTFFEFSDNLFDKDVSSADTRLNEGTGVTYPATGWQTSDYVNVEGGAKYTVSVAYTINFYDESNTFISSIKQTTAPRPFTYTTPTNAKKQRSDMRLADVDSYMLVNGSTLPSTYQGYYSYIPIEYIEQSDNAYNKLSISNFSSDFLLRPDLPTGTDLNTVFDDGVYTGKANGGYLNLPIGFDENYAFRLTTTSLFKGGNRWVIQSFVNYSQLTQEWRRVVDKNGTGSSEWQSFGGRSSGTTDNVLEGKTVVNFGDSIFGNTQGANSVSQAVQDRTGATVYNIGFGGSQMSTHAQYWDAFSSYNLADAIVNQDWTLMDDPNARNLRSYFPNTIDTLKTIDFAQVDYITFNWATNDYRQGKLLDDTANNENTNTFAGAMRYFLRTITEAYPEIKILVISPLWRYFNDESGAYLEDSTSKDWGGGALTEYVEKGKEVANEFNIPYLDAYHNLGINKHNRLTYFNDASGDTTHPLPNGNKRLGSLIGAKLISEF